MPKEMIVKVDDTPIDGVIDVQYAIGSGWDEKTGRIRGSVTCGPITIKREMQPDSFLFFKRACLTDDRFKVHITFRRQDPQTKNSVGYVDIELEEAVVVEYKIDHSDWKDTDRDGYDPIEVFQLGYKSLKMKTASGEYVLVYVPPAQEGKGGKGKK
jgi:type VI protein secretion system component Hcp